MAHCIFLVVFLSSIFCPGKIILLSILIKFQQLLCQSFPKRRLLTFLTWDQEYSINLFATKNIYFRRDDI